MGLKRKRQQGGIKGKAKGVNLISSLQVNIRVRLRIGLNNIGHKQTAHGTQCC